MGVPVRRYSSHSSGAGQKGPFADKARVGIEQVVHGLKAQVAHAHGVNLRIDQGHGKTGAPLAHHRALFLGQSFAGGL